MKRTPFRFSLAICLVLVGLGSSRAGIVYSAAGDFSANTNTVNSTWQYGTFNSPSSTSFLINSNRGTTNNLNWWINDFLVASPNIIYNPTGSTYSSSQFTLPAGQLALHPGSLGEKAVIRFKAPTSGSFALNTSVFGANTHPTSSNFQVLKNGISIYSTNVNSYGILISNSQVVNLSAGDTVDFAVGYGSNLDYSYDMTGMTATLQAVPEPMTSVLFSLGILLVVAMQYRRKHHVFAG